MSSVFQMLMNDPISQFLLNALHHNFLKSQMTTQSRKQFCWNKKKVKKLKPHINKFHCFFKIKAYNNICLLWNINSQSIFSLFLTTKSWLYINRLWLIDHWTFILQPEMKSISESRCVSGYSAVLLLHSVKGISTVILRFEI